MHKFGHEKEIVGFNGVPKEVTEIARSYLHTLDKIYGADRDVDSSDGGYVVIFEAEDDINVLYDIDLDVDTLTPEYCEIVKTFDAGCWSNTFILMNNETSVNILMPIEITPDEWRDS